MYFQVQRDYLKTNYWKKHITKFDNENYKMEMDIEGFHSFVKFLIAKGQLAPGEVDSDTGGDMSMFAKVRH